MGGLEKNMNVRTKPSIGYRELAERVGNRLGRQVNARTVSEVYRGWTTSKAISEAIEVELAIEAGKSVGVANSDGSTETVG